LPIDVRLSPDGRVFYVANQGLGGVTLIRARALTKIGFLHTGTGAHGLAVSRDAADLYVSNRLNGTISVVSFAKREVVKTWHVGPTRAASSCSTWGIGIISRCWRTAVLLFAWRARCNSERSSAPRPSSERPTSSRISWPWRGAPGPTASWLWPPRRCASHPT